MTVIESLALDPSLVIYIYMMYCRMMPLEKRGGVQMISMEVELVLKAPIIIGAEGAERNKDKVYKTNFM